ncbi:hypothetical protein L596_015306 [Steinernema carpocapsae]|uniref:Uncharacterized protein n=1 Tax=Steinernema carpocapsae TaxID=34508 RepID=A0A4U5NET5_STECR|nr:hypothetical protein L596_015306 [Steinernema carpocapsae]
MRNGCSQLLIFLGMAIVVLVILLLVIPDCKVFAFQQVTERNFLSIYFSNLWEVIKRKFAALKEFFQQEVFEKIRVEVPKLVTKVETEVPKFVQDLHIKEEFQEKTEAIANATTKVKRYFSDWDDQIRNTVTTFRELFIVVAVVFVVGLVAYLYLECSFLRKILLAIPRLIIKIFKDLFKWKNNKKKTTKKEEKVCQGKSGHAHCLV